MRYDGGKNGAGVYQTIINQLPPHARYFEPFAGSAAVLRMKRPAAVSVALDSNPRAVATLRAILEGSPFRAMRVSFDKLLASPQVASVDVAPGAAPKLFLATGDAILFLRRFPFTRDDLIYLDPPYLKSARRSQRDIYEHEFGTAGDHETLLRAIKPLPCRVVLSGYDSPLYARHLRAWRVVEYLSPTRGGLAVEKLWLNFDESAELHDYSFLGRTYREREKFKKRRRRLRAKLERMPEIERRALLAAVSDFKLASTAGGGDAGAE